MSEPGCCQSKWAEKDEETRWWKRTEGSKGEKAEESIQIWIPSNLAEKTWALFVGCFLLAFR